MAIIAAVGVTVEADAAQAACDVGDAEGRELALRRAELMLARVEAASDPEGGAGVAAPLLVNAYLLTAEADLARARDGDDAAERARAAAAAWEELGRPYPAAVARWRAAEALTAAGEREAAGAEAGAAREVAERLGAGWLAEEAEGLIARARLPLPKRAGAARTAPGREATARARTRLGRARPPATGRPRTLSA